jgi:hypothetical protein
MDISTLKRTGTIYNMFVSDWLFFGKAFRAGRPFIQEVLTQHPRESDDNFETRVQEAFNFPYAQNIVTIYNHFLTEKPAIREVHKSISDRDDWKKFQKNCDLYETPFEAFLNEAQKLSGAYGTIGLLVDFPFGNFGKSMTVAPYLSIYTPNNILDWKFERDMLTGIPKLTYLKLKESSNYYLIWYTDRWEKYKLSDDGFRIEKMVEGTNRLGEIPFIFFQNIKDSVYPYLGISDISDASYVNAAIVRAFSMGSEVLKMAGFPMLLYPNQTEQNWQEDEDTTQEEIVVGEKSVLPFDPELSNGKPDWLESPVKPSIEAILMWVDRLTEEAYRAANLSGLHESRAKAQAKSGVYLRYQFQQSNSVLSKKADTLVEAEKKIMRFWNMWCQAEKDQNNFDDMVKISRIKEFSIDSLQIELQNMIDSMMNVMSKTFKRKMQVRISKYTYPDLTDSEIKTINDEIEEELEAQKAAAEKQASGDGEFSNNTDESDS